MRANLEEAEKESTALSARLQQEMHIEQQARFRAWLNEQEATQQQQQQKKQHQHQEAGKTDDARTS